MEVKRYLLEASSTSMYVSGIELRSPGFRDKSLSTDPSQHLTWSVFLFVCLTVSCVAQAGCNHGVEGRIIPSLPSLRWGV